MRWQQRRAIMLLAVTYPFGSLKPDLLGPKPHRTRTAGLLIVLDVHTHASPGPEQPLNLAGLCKKSEQATKPPSVRLLARQPASAPDAANHGAVMAAVSRLIVSSFRAASALTPPPQPWVAWYEMKPAIASPNPATASSWQTSAETSPREAGRAPPAAPGAPGGGAGGGAVWAWLAPGIRMDGRWAAAKLLDRGGPGAWGRGGAGR
jgi:hypothetical protein